MIAWLLLGAALGAEPQRIVAFGAPVVELVVDLGAGDRLVGIDDATERPFPKLGQTRQLPVEAVLGARPDLVVVTDHAGPPAALDQLRQAGIQVEVFAAPTDLPGAWGRVDRLGALLGQETEAKALTARLQAELQAITPSAKGRRVAFVYARGAGTLLVGGTGTAVDALIRQAGGIPAVTEWDGFKPLTAESLLVARPEVLVLTRSGLESVGGLEGLLAVPGVAQTPAGAARRVVAIDDLPLLGFGTQLPAAVKRLVEVLDGP